MTPAQAMVGVLLAATATMGLHRAGVWGVPAVREAPRPTPAALATAAAAARAAARAPASLPAPAVSQAPGAAAQPPAIVTAALGAAVPAAGLAADPETEAALPEGPAREEVFAACMACHGSAIIRRSALTRDRWDELLDWMTEKHGMPALEGGRRDRIVDYLAANFAPRRARAANPFLTE